MKAQIAHLVQEFTGGYHLVAPDGRIVQYSTTLPKALAICERNGWVLR